MRVKQTNIAKLGRHMYLSLDEGVQSLGSPDSNWAPMYSDQIVFRNKKISNCMILKFDESFCFSNNSIIPSTSVARIFSSEIADFSPIYRENRQPFGPKSRKIRQFLAIFW